jgi:putative Holliday junction resolvase
MKYLGIDYGTKRTGVAFSDEGGRVAFPHSVLPTRSKLAEDLYGLCTEMGGGAFVLGRSISGNGNDNPVMKEIYQLGEQLKQYGEVFFEDERYTSQQAARIQGEGELHDASAAAIILQGYLDRINRQASPSDPYTISS